MREGGRDERKKDTSIILSGNCIFRDSSIMNEKQKEWIRFHSEGNGERAAARYGLKGWREENGDVR